MNAFTRNPKLMTDNSLVELGKKGVSKICMIICFRKIVFGLLAHL